MKVFQINDCDYWMAPTLEEAIADARLSYYGSAGAEDKDSMSSEARELTEAELDSIIYWEDDDMDEQSHRHWQCECGAMADEHCRWNGYAYEHHHGYPVGHVEMRNIHCRTFGAELARRVAAGAVTAQFATSEY